MTKQSFKYSRFSTKQPKEMVQTRKRHEEIRYATGKSSLGNILVASRTQGVIAIIMDAEESFAELLMELEQRFPEANIVEGESEDESLVKQIVHYIEKPSATLLDIPLDIRGTEFQRRTWQAVREIPFWQTNI